MTEATPRVAVIGTGIMGAPMAVRLAEAGFHVTAWNRTPGKVAALRKNGVHPAEDAVEAAQAADVVICMLSSGSVCEAILGGAGGVLAQMQAGSLLVIMSSISPETAVALAKTAAAQGIGCLDAPVSGGEKGAKGGTLAIMAGGEAAIVERLRPVLACLGRVTHVGPAGSGSLAKLSNQLIVASTICAIAEALTLAQQGGANPAKVREALLGGFADSTVLRQHGLRMVEEDFEPGGPAKYQVKDTKTALAFARAHGLTLPVSEEVDRLFQAMVDKGDGDLDHSGVIRELRRMNASGGLSA